MANVSLLNKKIGEYKLVKLLGEGATANVYLAEREGEVNSKRAIKLIPVNLRRPTWELEINKVVSLENSHVVPFIDYDDIELNSKKYTWIAWKYIRGKSLRELIEEESLTLQIILNVIRTSLNVLHSCVHNKIQHGDLHAGNIIVGDPDPADIDPNKQKIWVTDFGYLSVSMGKDMLDDLVGLSNILKECLKSLNFQLLSTKEKWIYEKLDQEFCRYLLDTDPIANITQRRPRSLLDALEVLISSPEGASEESQKFISDYLVAEGLGERFDEWKNLFVPVIVGSSQLFARNVCVMTGLRGCGKTMVFKRLSWKLEQHLGIVDINGADSFLGFYLNARVLAEAFAWIPEDQEKNARDQITHYFNCAWSIEVVEGLKLYCDRNKYQINFAFLHSFFQTVFGKKILVTSTGSVGSSQNTLTHLLSFLQRELDLSRLGAGYDKTVNWPLKNIDYIEKLIGTLNSNISWFEEKNTFLFLDDYSAPLVPPVVQKILNAIVFKRSAIVNFKIATESIESIELIGLNGKVLQQEDDFDLIDYSSTLLLSKRSSIREKIEQILGPRILRDQRLGGKHANLESIFGSFKYQSTELAKVIRSKSRTEYYGKEMFCDLWSSNVRDMIVLLADAVHKGTDNIADGEDLPLPLVSNKDQDKLFRSAGAKFYNALGSVTDPTKKIHELQCEDASFGDHMQKIANAFQEVASYDLLNKNSKNQDHNPPKQARRIEITDVSDDIPEDVIPYYKALVRYGIFMPDWRGKSARGKAVPRLVLRGALIPYFTLTFSRRDAVTLEWHEFINFLTKPKDFPAYWKKKYAQEKKASDMNQADLLGEKS